MEIIKLIHYCWFGLSELPENAKNCIESWKRYCPDYKIIEWNESNFDITKNKYIKEAYYAKKYAFVSDYVRYEVLYNFGGLYFDTDVEIIKPINHLLLRGPFMCCEEDGRKVKTLFKSNHKIAVASGLGLYAIPHMEIYKNILEVYNKSSFINSDGSYNQKTVVAHTTEILMANGLKDIFGVQQVKDIIIYPKSYFCPIDYYSGKLSITPDTVAIHHYNGSWQTKEEIECRNLAIKLTGFLGVSLAYQISSYCYAAKYKGINGVISLTKRKVKRILKRINLWR